MAEYDNLEDFLTDDQAAWLGSQETKKPEPYIRPAIPEETRKKIYIAAKRIIYSTAPKQQKFNVLLALMAENAQLLAEVNEHRAARGFELLKVYEPENG